MEKITERTPVIGWDNIIHTFKELGFGDVDFGPEFKTVYKDYHWILMPHPIAIRRFYAIPNEEELHSKPWDSWYFMEGKPVHHVHYACQNDSSWSEWTQPSPAPECPKELVGIPWYWYNEESVMPSLLIK